MLLFVDQLTNVDFSYLDPERGLVGETWLAGVELEGALDEQGMVCDFGIVKAKSRRWLDDTIDHCLLVPAEHPAIAIVDVNGNYEITMTLTSGETLFCKAPKQAITLVATHHINEASVGEWCVSQLLKLYPASVKSVAVSFVPEAIDGPYYHYSHGLRKHDGNCQRIAHGHRSKLEVKIDDKAAVEVTAEWAERWRDIYIGSTPDLINESGDQYTFAYTAAQGDFSLSLPKRLCYLIDTDSTVELIASHIVLQIKSRFPENRVSVRAYEGLAKGAVCSL
ncbi:6-carboxytetrahydropterin synthase [Teredinibacter turnerae]|uniref:6-carboxytetrahydropterin synthase n=1 Tax=Teredinibacter turnerae TaxID=2426 RepID=UPI0005F87329|nr:6-carboxytetrahydropterin synthase [Teredinibacter turnerae]